MNALNFKPKDKAEIISRLEDSINRLKNLPVRKFKYCFLVTEFDKEKNCGTKCCWAGWYPEWYAEYGFKWFHDQANLKYSHGFYGVNVTDEDPLPLSLSDFHGVTLDVIENLFYGVSNYAHVKREMQASKKDVIEAAEKILEAIKNGADFLLNDLYR